MLVRDNQYILATLHLVITDITSAVLVQAWNNGTFQMDASHAAVKPVGPARPAVAFKGRAPKQDSWAASAAAPHAKKGCVAVCLQSAWQWS